MINFTKNDSDRMVDFALSRDSLHNFTKVLLYRDEDYSKLLKAVSNELPIVTLSEGKEKDNDSGIIDVSRTFALVVSMLKNQYDIAYMSRDLTNIVFNSILKKYSKEVKNGSSNLCLEIMNECVRTIKFIKFDNDGSQYTLPQEKSSIKVSESVDNTYLAELVKNILSEIEIYNNEETNISYQQFSDILFKLPFLGDLLRASCSFNMASNSQFIKNFENLRVEVQQVNNDVSHNFMFVKFFDPSYFRNTNTTKFYNANEKISSAECFADIISHISTSKSLYENSAAAETLSFLYKVDVKTLEFYYNSSLTGELERLKLYDPLYSNFELRKIALTLETKVVHLIIKQSSGDDIQGVGNSNKKLLLTRKGFAMLKNVDGKGFNWMECYVKERDKEKERKKISTEFENVKFRCFQNKYAFYLPDSNIIYEELPIDFN